MVLSHSLRIELYKLDHVHLHPWHWMKYGVPHGTVFGLISLTMYTNIIHKHGLNFHLYTGDTQLFYIIPTCSGIKRDINISSRGLYQGYKDINKSNNDKTELLFGAVN